MPSMPRRSAPAAATTARPECGRTTTRTTTARSSSTPTATTPRPSATPPGEAPQETAMPAITRGFHRKRDSNDRLPPGQYLERGFPVLAAGPTPHVPLDQWDFAISGAISEERRWTWEEFQALPREEFTVAIHCVTTWSKLDTEWTGVSVDTLLDGVELEGGYVVAASDGGYTTNLPVEDVTGGKAWVAFLYDGDELEPEHGGPALLLVPYLYF